ncbi:MAG: hypothetical protein IH840_14595 [Candidatus Heimdallarchaeota archaeon]|nr:hypothetical protein [Candidatus Heimdallarchaeota archaeon]
MDKIKGFEGIKQDDKIHLFYNLLFLEMLKGNIQVPLLPANQQSLTKLRRVGQPRNLWFDA